MSALEPGNKPPVVRPYLAEPLDRVTGVGADWVPATADRMPLPIAPEPERSMPIDGAPSPVRPYLLTGGRARATDAHIEIEAQVQTTPSGEAALSRHLYEQHAILVRCRQSIAVAEVAASLGLHLGVARVLVSDLLAMGHLATRRPETGSHRDPAIIERVIRGLKAIH